MATPPPPPSSGQPPQQPQQPDAGSSEEAQHIVEILALGASLAVAARALASYLKLPVKVLRRVLTVIRYSPEMFRQLRGTSATDITKRANDLYRAAYIAKAARRVAQSPELIQGVLDEIRWYKAHQAAAERRILMAQRVDVFRRRIHSPLLGWYAVMDSRTTGECRAANGRNFFYNRPPVIGYPGAVHPNCRCTVGPPHPRGKMVDTSAEVQGADSATGFEQRSM